MKQSPVLTTSQGPISESDQYRFLEKLRQSTAGLNVEYTLATGEVRRRIYLDSTASTLQLGIVGDVMAKYLPYYANTHTNVHFNAILSTHEFEWARQTVLDFVQADPSTHGCFFVGSGTTGGINRIARTLARKTPERDVVITSIMEHHSNDLPHRKHFDTVLHVPVVIQDKGFGAVDVAHIEAALKRYAGRVNYVSVTGVSNVTGIINPIYDIAELAHRYDSLILVDAAQMAAHVPIRVSGHDNPLRNLDMVAMSGHKIYAPGSPGVVITRKTLFCETEPDEVGGGMVDDVHVDRYLPTRNFPDREEAGTPNIAGAIALATALYTLNKIGMETIDAEEADLINYAVREMNKIDNVVIYGCTDTSDCRRAGAVSFNVRNMHHSLTAAILNDYHNIAVRNACFCAHPYVREMITNDLEEQLEGLSNAEMEALAELQRGMVRSSFGIYNTKEDVDALVAALKDICAHQDDYAHQYHQATDSTFVHKTFRFDSTSVFSARNEVDHWLAN